MRRTRAAMVGIALTAVSACGPGVPDDAPSRSALLTPLSTVTAADDPVPTTTATTTPSETAPPAPPPSPVIVLLDTSTAMAKTPLAPGMTRLQAATSALEQWAAKLSADTPVTLVEFGSGAAGAACGEARVSLRHGTPSQFAENIAQVAPGAAASLGTALTGAGAVVPRDGRAQILVVSGPAGSCTVPPACPAAAQLHARFPDLAVGVIGVGAPAASLACITQPARGVATQADTPVQLTQRLGAMAVPDAAERLVVPLSGVGGVRIGMSLAQARAAEPTFPLGGSVPSGQLGVPAGSQAVIVWRGSSFALDEREVITAIVPGPDARTVDGLTNGVPVSNADAMLGKPLSVTQHDGRTTREYAADRTAGLVWRVFGENDEIAGLALTARGAPR